MTVNIAEITDRPAIYKYIKQHSNVCIGILPRIIVCVKKDDEIVCGICLYCDDSTSLCMASYSFTNNAFNKITLTKAFLMLFDALPSIAHSQNKSVLLLNINPSLQRIAVKANYEINNHLNTQAFTVTRPI